jgi:hypothetical protein
MLKSKLGGEATPSSDIRRIAMRDNERRIAFLKPFRFIEKNHNTTNLKKASPLKFFPS